mgnify:CR=1 FL=1
MNEEDLNIKYIREKTGLVENDELIPIILEMVQESYKAGLCQAEYDNTMDLIEENKQLKENNLAMQEEMARTWAKLQQKEDIINKTKSTINQMLNTGYSKGNTFYYDTKDGEFGARAEILLEILNNKGSDNNEKNKF